MKPSEAVLLLAKAAAFDRRTVGDADAIAWAEALGDTDMTLALESITQHYRETTDWIMPNHILRYVREIQQSRLRDAGSPDYPSDLTQAQERAYRICYQAAIKAGMSRDEATSAADRETAVTRLPEVEAPPEVRRAIADFERARSVPRAKPGDAA